MVDITHKSNTLRRAVAGATVKLSLAETLEAVRNKTVPKGDVLEAARVAGLFAVKRTADMIPDCHPLPVEYTAVRYVLAENEIQIEVEVRTIYKTGVEVEAMHGASVVALTIYDMLKPIDKGIEIANIRLLNKKGGKSDITSKLPKGLKAAVIVCSDSISAGIKEDKAGKTIIERLEKYGVAVSDYVILPDEKEQIQLAFQKFCDLKTNLVVFTGGTGLSKRDVTPEALKPMLDREIPGVMEAARNYGQNRTPYAMLSRGVAGVKGETMVLAVPGSTKGAAETMDALLPALLHSFAIMGGAGHD